MAPAPLVILFLSLALAALFAPGDGVRCWVCSSDVDPSCGDPFNVTRYRYLVTDCDRSKSRTPYLTSNALCRKLKHTVNGEVVIVRSCSWGAEGEEEGPCSPSSLHPHSQVEHCSTCSTDECNAASTHLASVAPLLGVALTALRL